MDSKVVSISLPLTMLQKVDEAAAISYQTRSNFIRMAIVEKFGAKNQLEFAARTAPDMHTDKQALKMYDFEEEYEDYMKLWNEENPS
jgi:metal-responsive CopG/Arc/MetJ family transcriptional regulator